MKLHLVFLFGFLASVVIVCGLIWIFAAYETADVWPLSHDPRISQDKWFEVIRNAVTTAAALGVGITLFFSYRRQQTAEQTQRIGAEAQFTAARAQKTAAAALKLSNKQHSLDQERRKDTVTAELRTRYAKTAEQLGSDHLAVRLAGVYSLAALADDWAEMGNREERQVCIDLLGAYYRSSQPGEENKNVRAEIRAAILDAVSSRLQGQTPDRKRWSRCNIVLTDPGRMPSLDGIVVNDGGALRVGGAARGFARISNAQLNGGLLHVGGKIEPGSTAFAVVESRLSGGRLTVALRSTDPDVESGTSQRRVITFRKVTLDGARLNVLSPEWDIEFIDCVFVLGDLYVSVGGGSVTFAGCQFRSDVFKKPTGLRPVRSKSLVVENCTFENDAPILMSVDGVAVRA